MKLAAIMHADADRVEAYLRLGGEVTYRSFPDATNTLSKVLHVTVCFPGLGLFYRSQLGHNRTFGLGIQQAIEKVQLFLWGDPFVHRTLFEHSFDQIPFATFTRRSSL